jgi:hypothetical protein
MTLDRIVAELDGEISRLQRARHLVAGLSAVNGKSKRVNGTVAAKRKRKKLSAAARAKISAAQKKRWAKTRKSAKKA